MAIRVDNLENLFWDNGSWKLPNTYPKLLGGKNFDKTPIMTTAVSGWVILEGDWNYCQYDDQLYFLKKDILISLKKKKYRYILIKDHFCNILKNKGNVFVRGTLTNASLDRLKPEDFNFTLPVINNFGKRHLFPLKQQQYNWKRHLFPKPPTKTFGERPVITPENFAFIIRSLENINSSFPNYNPSKFNEILNLFATLPHTRNVHKVSDWRNEIVAKIKELLSKIHTDDIVLGRLNILSRTSLEKNWCITHLGSSIATFTEDFKEVLNLDLSGLTDIVSVSLTKPDSGTRPFVPKNFKLFYDSTVIPDDAPASPIIYRLERRIRFSHSNPFSTRVIYQTGSNFKDWYLNDVSHYPQKILIKNTNPLIFKTQYRSDFYRNRQTKRRMFGEEYRSVYLYYCDNFNFLQKWTSGLPRQPDKSAYSTVLADKYSPVRYVATGPRGDDSWYGTVSVIHYGATGGYDGYYSFWKNFKDNKVSFPFGWLIGQFSRFIGTQDLIFDSLYPFLVRQPFNSLQRIKGFKPVVQQLIQNEDFFETQAPSATYDPSKVFTLDWFNYYPRRFIEDTKELDFQIGEKLLFFTWGPIAYTFFQPAGRTYDYGCYYFDQLLPNTVSRNISSDWTTYFYPYDLWNFSVPNAKGKGWIKKAYDNFKEWDYQIQGNPWSSDNVSRYKAFVKTHIKKNTEAFFEFEKVKNVSANEGDYFWTDLDYYWVDNSGRENFTSNPSDFLYFAVARPNLVNNDIVVYNDIKKGKLAIGKVTKIPLQVTLPEGQFVATDLAQDESSQNTIYYNAYRIQNIAASGTTFSDFNTLIEDLKENAHLYYADWFNFTLDQVKGEAFLFDLVGTNFYAYLDSEGKISLIFKNADDIDIVPKQVYSVDVDIGSKKLLPLQLVNQKAVLSFYGMKFHLPSKISENKASINVLLDVAKYDVDKKSNELVDSAKVEIRHSLGTSYFRFDIPKKLTRSQIDNVDPFQVEALESAMKRSYEDYRLQKQAQDLQFQAIDNQFDDQKWEISQARKENLVNSILTGIGQVTSFASGLGASGLFSTAVSNAATGIFGRPQLVTSGPSYMTQNLSKGFIDANNMVRYPSFGADVIKNPVTGRFMSMKGAVVPRANYGTMIGGSYVNPEWEAYEGIGGMFSVGDFRVRSRNISGGALLGSVIGQGISQIGSTLTSGVFNSERFDRQEMQLARDIELNTQNKLLQSYQLDLSFNRLRAGQALQLRHMFSFQSFSSISDRERNQILDRQEEVPVDEIYLELWVPSDEQLLHLENYHEKFGIDCRLPNQSLYIRDNMSIGLFRFEEPEVINLNDFIDLQLMKAKFAEGVHIVTWEESEVLPDLIPVDPRVLKLQNQLQTLQQKSGVLQKLVDSEKQRVEYLTTQVQEITKLKSNLEHDLEDEKNQLKALREDFRRQGDDLTAKVSLLNSANENVIRLTSEIATQGGRYTELAKSYRDVESDRDQQKQLVNLYKDEKTKLAEEKKDLETKAGQQKLEFDSLKSEKETIEGELKNEQTKVSALEKQNRELKDENIELHQELLKLEQAPKPTSEPLTTQKTTDYVISKNNSGDIVVLAWNSQYGIYREQKDLVVKKNKLNLMYRIANSDDVKDKAISTDNYQFTGQFVKSKFDTFKEKETKYQELVNNLDGKRDGNTTAKPETAYAWLSKVSVEVDHNMPYISGDEITDDTKLAREFYYHPTKGWFDWKVDGSEKVSTYKEYKEKAVSGKDNKITELEKTLSAVREIETSLRNQLKDSNVGASYNVMQYMREFMNVLTSSTIHGLSSPYRVHFDAFRLIVPDGFDGIYDDSGLLGLYWDSTFFMWQCQWWYEIRYSSYYGGINTSGNRNKQYVGDYRESYFGEQIDTWGKLKQRLRSTDSYISLINYGLTGYLYSAQPWCFPRFFVGFNSSQLVLETPLAYTYYWSSNVQKFVDYGGDGTVPIRTYGDYLNLFGLEPKFKEGTNIIIGVKAKGT